MIEEWFEDREREREMETKGKRIARGMEREKSDSYYG
jgi:hypothetical protein